MSNRPEILEQAATLSDPTRCRILLAVEQHELTVGELCAILQLPQSTVSRHLKQLRDQGWIDSRAEGTSRFYRGRVHQLEPASRRLWTLVRESLAASPGAASDRRRLEESLRQRRVRSEAFFAGAAGQWDALRDELFGRHLDLAALPALLDAAAVVGDLGCGTGRFSERLAPFAARVLAVDGSAAMLRAAQARLGRFDNVEVREGALERLPIADGELDVAAIYLALHHVADPRAALAEATRTLKEGGRLLVVDMQPHDREEYQRDMGHVWLGFAPEALESLAASVGLEAFDYIALPADLEARGPSLFVARARRARCAATAARPASRQHPAARPPGGESIPRRSGVGDDSAVAVRSSSDSPPTRGRASRAHRRGTVETRTRQPAPRRKGDATR
ncbi:MAG TPA: metalloregulator ArsR/SmtB family transcription factor [Thermoanaerobaculia bacterium]|nr:metalloregulator ArsR/SmtB family transcription factor [Thermoanaerobaculia bacterium]